MFGKIRVHSHRMYMCYCVLGFADHSIISSIDRVSDDDYFMDDDCYVFMGYGTDFEKCTK